jgi:serine/threonine protein kinase
VIRNEVAMTESNTKGHLSEPSPAAGPASEAPTLPPSSADGSSGEPATVTFKETGAPSADRTMPVVQGYEILEELGRGGMGVVYKARQISLKRVVALKMVLAGAHASAEDVARFRREAEAAAQLHHPNIVQIHEIGEQDGCPYFSLEFMNGGSLAQRIHGAPQPARWSAQLIETLARAIHVAHQHGIVHRDIKPGNVLLTSEGIVKITDFGLAKRLEAGGDQTKTGTVFGTPRYMPPEQASGKQRAINPRTDIYSLGAILYELLTGRPPFQAETPLDTLLQVLEREPIRPRSVNPAVPRDLETICLKAMAKEPYRRYASAEEMAQDLGRFVNGQPIQARPIGWPERFWRWCRRNPGLAGLSAVAAILLGALTILLATKPGERPTMVPDDSLARVQRSGKLVIATDPTYPPMEFRQGGSLAGYDIDLTRHLAQRLGVEAEFVTVEWDWQDLVKRLNSHEFDVLCSSVTVTEDRKRQVDFVEYERLPLVFTCKKRMAVRNEQDLAGKVVAVQTDTTTHQLVLGLKRKGIAIKQILVFPGAEEPFEAVATGQADVTLAHQPVAHWYAKKDPSFTVMGSISNPTASDQIGMVFFKDDKELQKAVIETLRAMKEGPVSAELRERWFGH